MNIQFDQIIAWVRQHLEFGAVLSVLSAVAAYVGELFYKNYFDSYFLDGIDINISFTDSARVFSIILLVSVVIVRLSIRKNCTEHPPRFITALSDNIPLCVILFFVCALATDFYLSNVESLSSWLMQTELNFNLREIATAKAPVVVKFLKKWIFPGSLGLSALLILILSASNWSFSVHLHKQPRVIRHFYLTIYIVLLLFTASACGRAYAFLERAGFLNRPLVKIILNDGTSVGGTAEMYLIVKTDSTYYIATVAEENLQMKTWAIPQSAIRIIEIVPSQSQIQPILQNFK